MQLRRREAAAPPPADDPLEFVMSDGSVDRMGDIIEPDGWQLDRFRRNPVALFGHDPSFPIGRWSDVGVRKGELSGRLVLMEPVSERLREIHTAVNAGVLRAVSVGFHSDSFEPLGKGGGLRFTEAELVECSLVSVPANPNALAVARSLGLSRETRALIFGVPADDNDQPASGSPGVPAVAQFAKSGTTRMNYAERIQAAQQEVVGLQDQLAALPDVEDVEKVGALTAKIGEVKNKIFAWVEAEKALGDEASPITIPRDRIQVFRPSEPLPASAPKAWAQPKRQETPPEKHILRHCVAIALAHLDKRPVEMHLAERYGSYGDFEVTKGLSDWWRTRAATAPATTTTAGWAAELAITAQGAWFNAVMPGSVFGPVSSRGMTMVLGRNKQLSMPTRQATPTIAGSFIAEGAPIPVRQAAFTAVTIGVKKMGVITSFTREIAEHSTPEIETILRQLIMDDTGIALDSVFLDNVAADTIRPAGIRNGVAGLTPTAITGGAFAALVTDLKNLVGALAAVNAMGQLVFLMHPVQQIAISLTQNAGGDFPFQAEINSNRLLGYPVVVSSTVPAGMVILINADDLMVVQGDSPRFDVSDQATIHFEDTTPLQISTGAQGSAVVATPVRSMFQTDSLALRMILPVNWAMRRTGSVAWVTGVTW